MFQLYIYLICSSSPPTGFPLDVGVEFVGAGTVDMLDDDVDELVSASLVDSLLISSFAGSVPFLAILDRPGLALNSSWRLLMNLL